MKKLICLFSVAALILAGCSTVPTPTQAPATAAPTAAPTVAPTAEPTAAPTVEPTVAPTATPASTDSPSATVAVDKGDQSVKLTIPVSLLTGGNIEDTITQAKAKGVTDVLKNDDGSLTYTMPNAVYEKMMGDMKASIVKSIDDMKAQGTYASIKDITYNDDFTEFTVSADQDKFKDSMDSFALLSIYIGAAYYEVFDNKPEPKVTFHLVDAATKAEFQKLVYPDDMKLSS